MSSWSNDDKTCYETALEIIDRAARYIEEHDRGENLRWAEAQPLADAHRQRIQAEIIPWLRGRSQFTNDSWAPCRMTRRCCGS